MALALDEHVCPWRWNLDPRNDPEAELDLFAEEVAVFLLQCLCVLLNLLGHFLLFGILLNELLHFINCKFHVARVFFCAVNLLLRHNALEAFALSYFQLIALTFGLSTHSFELNWSIVRFALD